MLVLTWYSMYELVRYYSRTVYTYFTYSRRQSRSQPPLRYYHP
jgi:hypothetical protein